MNNSEIGDHVAMDTLVLILKREAQSWGKATEWLAGRGHGLDALRARGVASLLNTIVEAYEKDNG